MRPACADRGCQPEEKWYAVTGRVVDAKVEADGDIHLALQDADGKNAGTVSAEIPVGPKWCEIRQIVFGWTKQKFPFTVKSVHDLTIAEHVVTVTGKAFYDIAHAPADHSNRRTSPKDYAVWEIHPVMKLEVVQRSNGRLSLTISTKPVGAWAGFQLSILKGGQSGLLTRMATETVSSCAPTTY